MSETLERTCPTCGTDRTFTQVASMEVHLGTKVKWSCPECGYRFVRIDGNVDSAESASA